MPGPAAHRFTVEEYYGMGETGIIGPEANVELLDGQVIDMGRITPLHSGTVIRLTHLLSIDKKNRWIASVKNPVHLGPYSEPRPDFMLAKPIADFYKTRHPGPEDVLLLMEVADNSLAYDRDRKIPAYARAGIPEVWIINLLEQNVEMFRDPHFTAYTSVQKFDTRDTISPKAFPDVRIDLGALLKRTG